MSIQSPLTSQETPQSIPRYDQIGSDYQYSTYQSVLIWWGDNISHKLAEMKPLEKIEDIKDLVAHLYYTLNLPWGQKQ